MKTKNHESYTTCKNCGHEYNFWDFGPNCPACFHTTTTRRPSALCSLRPALCALLFALYSLPFALCAQPSPPSHQSQPSQKSQPSQFLITIKTGRSTAIYKHANTATADSLTTIYTGKTTAQLLANSPFYEHRNKTTWFYIEQKKLKIKNVPNVPIVPLLKK